MRTTNVTCSLLIKVEHFWHSKLELFVLVLKSKSTDKSLLFCYFTGSVDRFSYHVDIYVQKSELLSQLFYDHLVVCIGLKESYSKTVLIFNVIQGDKNTSGPQTFYYFQRNRHALTWLRKMSHILGRLMFLIVMTHRPPGLSLSGLISQMRSIRDRPLRRTQWRPSLLRLQMERHRSWEAASKPAPRRVQWPQAKPFRCCKIRWRLQTNNDFRFSPVGDPWWVIVYLYSKITI